MLIVVVVVVNSHQFICKKLDAKSNFSNNIYFFLGQNKKNHLLVKINCGVERLKMITIGSCA